MLERLCSQIIRWGAYLSVIFIPLLVNPWAKTSFEIIKNTGFRTVVGVMLIAFVVSKIAAFGSPYRRKEGSLWNNGIFVSAVIMCAVTVLATFVALNFHLSFFGSYVRMQGLFTQLHYWVLFGLIISEFRTMESLWKLISAMLVGGFMVSLIGLFQMAGYDVISAFGASYNQARLHEHFRALSTLGQPNFLGQYLVMLLPFGVAGIVRGKGRARTFYYGVVAAMFVVLLGTLSRAAWIGLGVSGLFFGFGFLIKTHRFVLMKKLSVVLGLLMAVFLFINFVDTPLKTSDVAVVRRVSKVLDSEGATSQSRLYNWYTAFTASTYSPLIGFGPESYNYLYSKFQPEEILAFESSDKLADRAHNIFLDRIVTTGYLGLLSSVFFGVVFMVVGIRTLLQSKDYDVVWLLLATLSSALAFFVADLFGFGLVVVNMILWIVLALTVIAVNMHRGYIVEKMQSVKMSFLRCFVAFLCVASGVVYVIDSNVSVAVADVYFKESICSGCSRDGLDVAMELAPHNGYYGFFKGYYLVKEAERRLPAEAVGLYKEAELVFNDAYRKSQREGDYYLNLARMYASWGGIDPSKHDKAVWAFEKAAIATPKKPRMYKEWAEYMVRRGHIEQAIELYEAFSQLYHPDQDKFDKNMSLKNYADLLDSVGREDEFKRVWKLYLAAEKLRELSR